MPFLKFVAPTRPHIVRPFLLRMPALRMVQTTARRLQDDPQTQPAQPAQSESPKYSVKNYRGLELPWLRVFLAALLTYQLSFWAWEKMRTDEIVAAKTAEVEGLEKEIDAYKQKKAA